MSETLIIGIGFLTLVGIIAWLFRGNIEVALEILGSKGSVKAESAGPLLPPTAPNQASGGEAEVASGTRTVQINGSADGATVVSGDGNTVMSRNTVTR